MALQTESTKLVLKKGKGTPNNFGNLSWLNILNNISLFVSLDSKYGSAQKKRTDCRFMFSHFSIHSQQDFKEKVARVSS